MTFNLKLFKFLSQDPIITFSNSKCIYKIEPITQPSNFFSLKLANILNTQDYENCLNEVNIHAMASQSNIISFKGYVTTETTDEFGLINKKFFILLEFHDHNLAKEIKNRRKRGLNFSFEEIIKILGDLLEALIYLERKNICFRNISPENVFIFENDVKLGNFENAFNSIGEGSTKFDKFKGNIKYAEPKVFQAFLNGESEIEYNYFKNDVFALGIMILEIIFLQANRQIFETIKIEVLYQKIQEIKDLYGKESQELVELLMIMLKEDSKERPNFIQINEILKKMPIFNKKSFQILSPIKELQESDIRNKFIQNNSNPKDLLPIQMKFDQSLYIQEEKKNESSDSLNERDSVEAEEIKEVNENNKKRQPQKTNYTAKESCFSSKYFGLDRDSNLLISEFPALNKFSPEKISMIQKLRQNFALLNLKMVDLESLKIETNRPMKMNYDGDVFFCSNKSHLNLVVKIIKGLNEENIMAILRRYEYINARNSKNILKLEEYAVDYIYESNLFTLFLVFKVKKWDLKYAIQNKNFSALDKLSIAKQIVKVLYEFNIDQKERIVHGNLKPSNILLDNKNMVFLTDFGTSETFIEGENLKKSRKFTLSYSPPEQFLYKRLELNSDIWSLGVIFCELFFNLILSGENIVALGLYDEIRKESLKIQEDLIGEILWKKKVAIMIQRMTFFESFKRISLQEISMELDSIENMIKYPSSLHIYQIEEEPSSFEKKSASKNFHTQKNSFGFLTKQPSHSHLKKQEKSNGLDTKKYFSTPKTFSRKIKTTK